MNKANLKASWGAYCDTDKLVDDLMALFTKYGHRNTEYGVCVMLDEYFKNKEPLIKMLQKSPHYIGDMRVCIDEEMERYTNKSEVSYFCDNFYSNVEAKKAIVKTKDKNGKGLNDYIKTGIKHVNAKDFMIDDNPTMKLLKLNSDGKNQFNNNGELLESVKEFNSFRNQISYIGRNCASTLDEEVASEINKVENCKVVSNMKTARAFNRICAHYGVDKCENYNKLFAQYADMVSGLKRNIKFFISANPIDYLSMSVGVNWTSCHRIGGGRYQGGCASYMLDETSLITFVHDHIPTDWANDGKIYRCMFHYGNDILLQSRTYPQGNDGNTNLYSVFRGFVQTEISEMLGVENDWAEKINVKNEMIISKGVHYKDYLYNQSCNFTYLKKNGDWVCRHIKVGHEGICPCCGENLSVNSSFSHRNCISPVLYTNSTSNSSNVT